MANKLKTGKIFSDNYGNSSNDYYMVVTGVEVNQQQNYANIRLSIWASETAKGNNQGSVANHSFTVQNDPNAEVPHTQFDTYFDDAVLKSTLNSPTSQAYLWLGTEQPDIQGVVWADWKSDEVTGVPQTLPSRIEDDVKTR